MKRCNLKQDSDRSLSFQHDEICGIRVEVNKILVIPLECCVLLHFFIPFSLTTKLGCRPVASTRVPTSLVAV
jgi:hypothetical protein